MKETGDGIKLIVVGSTLFANAFLIYILLYDPFSKILVHKNQPYLVPKPNTVVLITTFIIMALLVCNAVVLLIWIYKKRSVFIAAPLFTVVVIAALMIVSKMSLAHPSSSFEYSAGGYYYKKEIWWNRQNHIRTCKQWKSIERYDGKKNPDEMKYNLDSISNIKEK